MTIQVRNSDITTFKHCREEWNYSSPHKLNIRPNKSPKHFGFGTALHSGEEAWYNPTAPYNKDAALDAFLDKWAGYVQDCFNPQEWGEMRDLGLEMLNGYFAYSLKEDDFAPRRVEVEFEVPILVPKHIHNIPSAFDVAPNDNLLFRGMPVVYAGRLDLLGELATSSEVLREFVIVDHKSTVRFYDLTHLEMDEQLARYGYAMWVMGFNVVALYYNQLLKAIPSDPELLIRTLKSGKVKRTLSKDKAALGVTAERYISAVAQHGLNLSDYADHIQWLQENPPKFFRRKVVRKTPEEYRVIEERLFYESVDMLNDPYIYPSPNSNWGCTNCLYRDPCLDKIKGKSDAMILRNNYHTREDDE